MEIMRLRNKIAVVYGAGGANGGAVARAFAREGARVFLAGRHLETVEAVAGEIISAGGFAEAAKVDALDEAAVDAHLESVVEKNERIDISFNATGIPNTTLHGVPLVELGVEQFSSVIATSTRSNFLTARLAARRMVPRRSGVILTITAIPARTGIPLVGGVGSAMAAVEALVRNLSAELAQYGVRVVGLRTQGAPESGTIQEIFRLHAKAYGIAAEQFQEMIALRTHARRFPSLAELANAAVFMVSDEASALTGTIGNLSLGSLDD